ncbi:MAG TPA: DUF3540 domain-containing protein [Byssovorax sp.]|jgi:hypothetical protein
MTIDTRHDDTQSVTEIADYLGPAEVTDVRADEVVVTVPGGRTVRAALALASPYQAVVGDVLLVIGRGAHTYAIGVLFGAGKTTFSLQGDVELRAVGGKLSLTGDRGVDITTPSLDVRAGALRVIAKEATQRFGSLCQRVTSLLRVHAGEAQTLVDGDRTTHAKRSTLLTEETVTINGREVHLG